MANSLLVFLAFTGFLIFGYFSLVRMMLKNTSPNGVANSASLVTMLGGFKQLSLANLGSSAFFVSLPATSLLLFWGWGPALLWLLIFHLFIESFFQIHYSSDSNQRSIADHLLRADNPVDAALEQGIIQVFFLLLMATVIALLSSLIDTQPGLLFALLFLLPARALLRNPSPVLSTPSKIVGCVLLIVAGIMFSDKLGFSIYGNWAPFGETVAWLRFNNPTVIAIVLIIATFRLDANDGFKQDVSSFAGAVIAVLIIASFGRLLWLNPSLDAPLNIADGDQLPVFISISLLLFAGLTILFIRLLNDEQAHLKQDERRFVRLQNNSQIHLLFVMVLLLSLASALGIGAWKTHYLNWTDAQNVLQHLNLAISSMVSLIHFDARSGTLSHTILLASLCLTGFSFMLMCCSQLNLEEPEHETFFSMMMRSKAPQAVLIFFLSVYFIDRGVHINTWMIIGLLAWVLVTHLSISLATQAHALGNKSLVLFVVALAGLGYVQALWLGINWSINGIWHYALTSLALFIITTRFWLASLITLTRSLMQNQRKKSIF